MKDNTSYGKKSSSLEYWATHRNSLGELYPSEAKYFVELVKKCDSVLDIGCAAGGFSEVCRSLKPDIQYAGLDISSNLISLAQKKYSIPSCKFYIYDGVRFPQDIINHKYDMVYSFGVLHHVSHWSLLVSDMLAFSNNYVCFDLRLTYSECISGYQRINFNEDWDGSTKVEYNVLNLFDTLKQVVKLAGSNSGVSVYGYELKPTEKAKIDIDKVIMASFCIKKNVDKPSLGVNII